MIGWSLTVKIGAEHFVSTNGINGAITSMGYFTITYLRYILLYCLITVAGISHAQSQAPTTSRCSQISLQILGSGGPEINDGLASTSYLIWMDGKARIMIDAGGGSSLNFERSHANFNDLEAILFTHFHVDHSAALPVYIKAGYFTHRDKPLPVFGPSASGGFPSSKEFLNSLISDQQSSSYPYLSDNLIDTKQTLEVLDSNQFVLHATSLAPKSNIWQKILPDNIIISTIQVLHGNIPALAWRVDIGDCSISVSGDFNGTSGNLQKLAWHSDLLVVHNAIPQDAGSIAKFLHVSPVEIGIIAEKAKAKRLLLSHFMQRTVHIKDQTQQMIRRHYHGPIHFAEDLMRLPLVK